MKRLIIAASLILSLVLVVEVSGIGNVIDRGPTIYMGFSFSCVPDRSITDLHYRWKRTETHVLVLPRGAHPKGAPVLLPAGVGTSTRSTGRPPAG